MKIIFLDIDGVLNCKSTPNPRKFPYVIDPKLKANLDWLLERTGAQVVLSSTWRCDPVGVLAARHFGVPIGDLCPDCPGEARGSEMREWLSDHPSVSRFVVVDDDDDGLDGLPLFQADPREGLTSNLAAAAAQYLNGESEETLRRPKVVRLLQNLTSVFNRAKS